MVLQGCHHLDARFWRLCVVQLHDARTRLKFLLFDELRQPWIYPGNHHNQGEVVEIGVLGSNTPC